MGITYGDHLIDSGYYDITPEQEQEIEERKGTEMTETERLWCKACGTVTRDMRCDCNCWPDGHEMRREPNFVNYTDSLQADCQKLERENDTLVKTLELLRSEVDRLQEAKRRALDVADERAKEANAAWQRLGEAEVKLERAMKALQQIITVCGDNADPKAKHDMALRFVRDVAKAVLSERERK